jgi:hypothetical protein
MGQDARCWQGARAEGAGPSGRGSAAACAPSLSAGPLRPLVFLDIEASSLMPGSWPIEIGWAQVSGGAILQASAVIAPRPEWPEAAWSEASAGVHGLDRARVAAGEPADAVASTTDWLAGHEVVSDNARWDQVWLDRLRTGRPRVVMRPLRAVAAERLSARQSDALALALLRGRSVHRAGEDAARLARAWAEAVATASPAAA